MGKFHWFDDCQRSPRSVNITIRYPTSVEGPSQTAEQVAVFAPASTSAASSSARAGLSPNEKLARPGRHWHAPSPLHPRPGAANAVRHEPRHRNCRRLIASQDDAKRRPIWSVSDGRPHQTDSAIPSGSSHPQSEPSAEMPAGAMSEAHPNAAPFHSSHLT